MKTSDREIITFPDRAALAREAARRFLLVAQQAIAKSDKFSVALSGGSTPRDLYMVLASPDFSSQVDWQRVYFFWGDERAVPPDHPDSNYRMAAETLLAYIPVPAQNAYRISGEMDPEQAARKYEQRLREFFALTSNPPTPFPLSRLNSSGEGEGGERGMEVPQFDLILLGLGEDGHTASLFPHTAALRDMSRWVVAQHVEKVNMDRITFTVPLINAAQNIFFIVAGVDKAKTVRDVLRGDYRPDDLPAQLIQPEKGNLFWLLDRDAASGMEIGN